MKKSRRIQLIDTLRGFVIVVMIFYHLLYDMGAAGLAPWRDILPILNFIQPLNCIFVLLAGVSCRFSRSNLRRGAMCFAVALVITLVTSLPFIDSPVIFGVLHLLGICMMLFGVAGPLLDRIPRPLQPFYYGALAWLSKWAVENISVGEAARFLFPLGWTAPGFFSSDYFPLFPWLFIFLLGTWAGTWVAERRLPGWFYDCRGIRPLNFLGRHSLIIYVLHQPVLYGIVTLISMAKSP